MKAEKKITFQIFSKRMKNAFTHPDYFDVDKLNDIYICYKEGLDVYAFDLNEWIEFFFIDWNLNTHTTMLKSKAK